MHIILICSSKLDLCLRIMSSSPLSPPTSVSPANFSDSSDKESYTMGSREEGRRRKLVVSSLFFNLVKVLFIQFNIFLQPYFFAYSRRDILLIEFLVKEFMVQLQIFTTRDYLLKNICFDNN